MDLQEFIKYGDLVSNLLNSYEKSSLLISDTEKFIYVSTHYNLGIHEGDQIKEGSAVHTIIHTKQPYTQNSADKKAYTVAGVPIFDQTGQVSGAIIWIHPNNKEIMKKTGQELTSLSEKLYETSTAFAQNSDSLVNHNQSTYQHILELDSKIGQIESVSKIITSITSQTHLLGLNAAIEAARVGEYGRGFTVVASEIRKLADQTKHSVKDINELVNNILESMKSVLHLIQENNQASEQQAASAQELYSMVSHISKLSHSLTEGNKVDIQINWNNSYSVEVQEIDSQHKTLVDLINELCVAIEQKRSNSATSKVIEQLTHYTKTHFKWEEEYMERVGHMDLASHKAQHKKFVDRISEFEQAFKTGKATLTFEIIEFLKDWLIKHIMVSDKKYMKDKKNSTIRSPLRF
jgi:hemerythrin-like metal-binding protein